MEKHLVPEDLLELESSCDITYVSSSGPGGQNVNKTATKVRLFHRDTGITIVCSQTRSQHQNKVLALCRLKRKLEAIRRKAKPRIPTQKSRQIRSQEIDDKKHRSRIKQMRIKSIEDE